MFFMLFIGGSKIHIIIIYIADCEKEVQKELLSKENNVLLWTFRFGGFAKKLYLCNVFRGLASEPLRHNNLIY